MFRSLFARTDDVEYDFGIRVVAIRTKKEVAANQGGYWFQRAKIRRLGDQFFFTGEATDAPDGTENPYRGVVFWYLLSEIEQMREFPDLQSAMNSWQTWEKLSANGAQGQTGANASAPAQPGATPDQTAD